MANTVVGFTINIEGINTVKQLNDQIKQTKKELEELTVGEEKYIEKSKELGKLVAEQKKVRDAQKEVNKEVQATAKGIGAYDQLSAKLNKLRKDYKNLAAEGKENTAESKALLAEITKLDRELKKIDGTVGQFQRNVGNYPKGIGRIIKQMEQVVPQLQGITSQLQTADGKLSGFGKAFIGAFLAFQAGKYIVQAIDQLNKLSEQFIATSNTVQEFSNLTGQALEDAAIQTNALATTFDADAEEISAAAASIATSMGISFTDALQMVEDGLLNSTVNAEDFLSTMQEAPELYNELTQGASEYAGAQKTMLDANKELSAAQAELAKEFGGAGNSLAAFGTKIKAYLIVGFTEIIKIFKPVGKAFYELGQSLASLFGFTQKAGEGMNFLQQVVKVALWPFQALAAALKIIANVLKFIADGFTYLREEVPIIGKIFDSLGSAVGKVGSFFTNLPFIFAGVIASLKQLATNFVNFFKILLLDTQIFGDQVRAFFGANVDDAIAELRRRRAEIVQESKSLGQAFSEAYNSAKEDADRRARERQAAEEEEARKLQAQKDREQQAKTDAESLKQRREAQKELYKKLQEDRRKFLEEEAKFLDGQLAIQVKLQQRANDLLIKGIADTQKRAIAEEDAALKKRIEQAEGELEKLVELAQAYEDEAVRLFGLNSEQAIKIREEAAARIAQAEKTLNEITERETAESEKRKAAIRKQFDEKAVQDRTKAYEDGLKQIANAAEAEILFLDEQRAKGLINESEYQQQLLEITLNRIDAEMEAQRAQLELNKKLAAEGVAIQEGQNEEIARQLQILTTERAKAERSYTDFVKQESKEREDAETAAIKKAQEDREKLVQSIADTFAKVSDLFSQVFDVAAERRMKRIEDEEAANQQAITAAEERIQNTTGLERQYYEQQLAQYQQTQEQFTKIKESEARKQALKDKAIAVGESIINTALAVTKALASAPPPVNVGLALAAGAAGAIQTGVIIAQPFATGGRVGAGNIPRQPNGDNVLATVKTNEVVLTENQQRMLGGAPVFRAIGVKGFASGGLVGAPTTVLNSATENLASAKEQAVSVNEAIAAINGRFDRLQVVWTPNSQLGQDKALQDSKEIKNTTQF